MAWAVGDNMNCIRTENGGSEWSTVEVDLANSDDLNDVFFISEGLGWTCGEDGRIYRWNDMVSTEETWAAKGYHLFGNAPNPFQNSTTISFEIPQSEMVDVRVYNLNGQMVSAIAPQNFPAGPHQINFNGADLAEGIYFCELKAGEFIATKKMVILR